MENAPAYDIREIRPVEIAAALELLDDAPGANMIQRRLSVGAIDPADGTLRGVALHETLDPRGCVVHLHCDDPDLGRLLLDRSLRKSAAEGHHATRVTLHPQSEASDLWIRSAWPPRVTGAEDGTDSADAPADQPQAESDTESAPAPETNAAAAPDESPDADADVATAA